MNDPPTALVGLRLNNCVSSIFSAIPRAAKKDEAVYSWLPRYSNDPRSFKPAPREKPA